MPSAYTGASQVFKIGLAANSLTTISGNGNGLATVSLDTTTPHRVIPGGGDAHRQLTGTSDWTLSFTVDANATTWPILAFRTGTKLYFEFSPIGAASGTPKYTGGGLMSVPLPAPTDDVITFDVTVEADGPLTTGTN